MLHDRPKLIKMHAKLNAKNYSQGAIYSNMGVQKRNE